MPITKAKKQEIVKELKEKFQKAKITFFSDFHGVSVAKIQSLRRKLKKDDAEYKVAKKTLIDKALAETGILLKTKDLQGELGVALGYGDEVNAAKALVKFGKENDTFKVVAGILGSRILQSQDVVALAKLPPREVLLAQVVGAMSGPIRGLATALQGNIRNLVVLLNKIKENKTSA